MHALVPATLLAAATLAACSASGPAGVEHLIEQDLQQQTVGDYTDDGVTDRLERLADEIAAVAVDQQLNWSQFDSDVLNPQIHDVVFVSDYRGTAEFAGGSTVASVGVVEHTDDDQLMVSMSAEVGSCWGMKLSGDSAEPDIVHASLFSPPCAVDDLRDADADHQDDGEQFWFDQWPAPAQPGGDSGLDPEEFGTPPGGEAEPDAFLEDGTPADDSP